MFPVNTRGFMEEQNKNSQGKPGSTREKEVKSRDKAREKKGQVVTKQG